jgi:hypothetical protein
MQRHKDTVSRDVKHEKAPGTSTHDTRAPGCQDSGDTRPERLQSNPGLHVQHSRFQESFVAGLAMWVLFDMRPVSMVLGYGFSLMAASFLGKFRIPSRQTLTRRIKSISAGLQKEVQDESRNDVHR